MKTKKLIGLIAICVLGAISLGSFFGLTRATVNDIAGFDFKTVNEANYFKVDLYMLSNVTGAPFDISEDGEITFKFRSGQDTDAINDMYINIQSFTLDEGKYVFKSGLRNTSKDTYCLMLKEVDAQGEPVENGDIIYSDTSFEVKETTTYTAYFFLAAGNSCDGVTLTPVLVDKGQKAKFYVYDFNPFDNED